MKCIDNELIQKYIDQEIDVSECEKIEKHLRRCSSCASLVEEKKTFSIAWKIEMQNLKNGNDCIPEWKAPNVKKQALVINSKHLAYAIAACVLGGMLLFFYPKKQEIDLDNKILIHSNIIRDFDANRSFSQQETSIILIDSDGKIIELY